MSCHCRCLAVDAPSPEEKLSWLSDIAQEHSVEWDAHAAALEMLPAEKQGGYGPPGGGPSFSAGGPGFGTGPGSSSPGFGGGGGGGGGGYQQPQQSPVTNNNSAPFLQGMYHVHTNCCGVSHMSAVVSQYCAAEPEHWLC